MLLNLLRFLTALLNNSSFPIKSLTIKGRDVLLLVINFPSIKTVTDTFTFTSTAAFLQVGACTFNLFGLGPLNLKFDDCSTSSHAIGTKQSLTGIIST